MLAWFILGLSVLAAVLLGGRWFATADPKLLAKVLKWGGLAILAAAMVFLAVTGRIGIALVLAAALATLARRWHRIRFPSFSANPRVGQASEASSEYLAMTLDHDSGEMRGRVLRGRFAGRELHELDLDLLLELLAECELNDADGARLLETYLDRTQGDAWRAAGHGEAGGGAGGRTGGRTGGRASAARSAPMAFEEAYEILGLAPGASEDEIKEAHRKLMQKIHPDHGGSTYLAAKINQAKDVLLGA